MCGFYSNIGFSNILHAEILSLLHEIQICWDESLSDIICYTDSIRTHVVQYADVFTHHYGQRWSPSWAGPWPTQKN